MMLPAALWIAVAIARRFSFLFILIVQSVGCTAQHVRTTLHMHMPSSLLLACNTQPPQGLPQRPMLNSAAHLGSNMNAKRPHTLGPKTTPPPGRKGVRLDPIRALPVPFCAKGFRPPPRTSARVSVLAVPCTSARKRKPHSLEQRATPSMQIHGSTKVCARFGPYPPCILPQEHHVTVHEASGDRVVGNPQRQALGARSVAVKAPDLQTLRVSNQRCTRCRRPGCPPRRGPA